MVGFNHLCGSHDGLALSSKWILCMTTEGLIPLMSSIDHPIASLCSFRTSSSFHSRASSRSEPMITGKDSEGPRNSYLRVSGSSFMSNLGGSTTEGDSGDEERVRGITLG